ncbi:uroporphyrinogen-III synthase [Lyticum sinuosum]|uniref:Uroporphyrinogen-III synthase n=1 Tax=Lyticum sinuosum TaxID=1332059 RepID=A0AAE4VMG9_9RICK|nr:uroporphyrinogen-III synthase [Lyticum sinuosum]MDZ5761638.1 uroporphyrinogen-III synthase [Lyticum sinuosum]
MNNKKSSLVIITRLKNLGIKTKNNLSNHNIKSLIIPLIRCKKLEYDSFIQQINKIIINNNISSINIIICSQNAVEILHSMMKKYNKDKLKFNIAYCVGKKTGEMIDKYKISKENIIFENALSLLSYLNNFKYKRKKDAFIEYNKEYNKESDIKNIKIINFTGVPQTINFAKELNKKNYQKQKYDLNISNIYLYKMIANDNTFIYKKLKTSIKKIYKSLLNNQQKYLKKIIFPVYSSNSAQILVDYLYKIANYSIIIEKQTRNLINKNSFNEINYYKYFEVTYVCMSQKIANYLYKCFCDKIDQIIEKIQNNYNLDKNIFNKKCINNNIINKYSKDNIKKISIANVLHLPINYDQLEDLKKKRILYSDISSENSLITIIANLVES